MCSSRHPWYYVSGRRDLTEKRIALRREREAQHQIKCENDLKYFNRCDAQTKLYDQWNHNKSMVKHIQQQYPSKPPFDVMIDAKQKPINPLRIRQSKEDQKRFEEWRLKISDNLSTYHDLKQQFNNITEKQKILISLLNDLMETRVLLKQKREFWRLKENRLLYVRFGRDRLRQRMFAIYEQLDCFKLIVKSFQDFNDEKLFNDEEMSQLSEVNDGAIKILDIYIQLNNGRSYEFHFMFHEEGEKRWLSQNKEWNDEINVCNTLIDKLIDTYHSIFKEKLNHLITSQKEALTQKEQIISELSSFANKFKRDSILGVLLTQDISHI